MRRLSGLKEIAAALGVRDEDTVTAWGALAVDPLPLRDWMGSVCAWAEYVADWMARRDDLAAWRTALAAWHARMPRDPTAAWMALNTQPVPTLPILAEWEDIAASIGPGVSADTAQRAAALAYRPLPVVGWHRPEERLTREGGPPRVWLYQTALRDWIDGQDRPHHTGATRGPRATRETLQLPLF